METKYKHKIHLKTKEELKALSAENPIDYTVPDYGPDQDIATTLNNAKRASQELGVKNFDPTNLIQAQEDLRLHKKHGHRHQQHERQRARDDPACGGLGCIDYHNGYDSRAWIPLINNAQEEEFKHLPLYMRGKEVVKNVPDDPPRLSRIDRYTDKQTKSALAQMRSRSDPVCSSAGCEQYKFSEEKSHPINYPVPDFGQDQDIRDTLGNEQLGSKMVGHQWQFKTAESKEKWANKAKDVNYNFAPHLDRNIIDTMTHARAAEGRLGESGLMQSQSEINLRSDPHCSSAGCTQYKFPEPDAKNKIPRDYPVPDFGPDRDIVDTIQHAMNASAQLKHTWVMGTEESKKQWRNRAEDAKYNFAPKLEGDMVDTQHHLAGAEASTGQKWEWKEEDNQPGI